MISFIDIELDALRQLGERLATARLQRKDRQVDMAARIGVTVPTYRKMEAGDPTVAMGYWIRAMRMFGRLAEVDQLLGAPASVFEQIERAQTKSRKRAPRRRRDYEAF